MDPAVAALKPPWPRGLPLQCLMGPVNVAVESAFAQTPFMADRAAEIVMADPAIALVDIPNDKETRRAVGQFVDSFDIALAIYVMQCPQGHERDSRVQAAWSHAVNALSRGTSASSHAIGRKSDGRLSENEAEMFWRHNFEKALPQVEVPRPEMEVDKEYPTIPSDIDPREPFEWNPAAMLHADVESRELPATILDCVIAAPQWLQRDTQYFHIPKPKTQAISSSSIWSFERLKVFRKLSRPVQEGMIAAALLFESSRIKGSKILALPFPSEFNVRYPSLFLDHDFLLSGDILCPPADVALSHFIKVVPSTLLLDLTVSALDAVSKMPSDSTKLASTEHTAYGLLKLLSKSDRPHLASSLVIRTILDRPDASSWHRQLLSKSFIRGMWARQAQGMISFFASSVLEVLEHQAKASSNRHKIEGSDTSSARRIKVTTVKFLAQFLDDANFVSPGFCVDILSKLFQTAAHVDIRVAVLDSMLSRLGRCVDESSNTLAERLMSALEMVIPILGSLNERQQTQDADWAEAEETGKLPEVYDDGGMQAFPPMLDMMICALSSHRISSDILRRGYIRRIVLPVIEKSKEESARWVKMFTLKHLPAGQSIYAPYFPARPGILVSLLRKCSSEVPECILDLYHQFFLTNVSSSAGLVELNKKVNNDVELRNSNEGQYWLSLYGQGPEISTGAIVRILTKPWTSSVVSDGIQISHIQNIILEQAEALLQVADESFVHWNNFVAALEPPVAKSRSDQDRKAWVANGKPVILRIVERIDALRIPAWQRDRNRQPAVLPCTIRLRLWSLDYPQLCQSLDPCSTFAQQIVSVLQETIDLGLSHHDRLDEIESALSRCLPDYGIDVALCLGNVKSEDSRTFQENLLRVELADGLLGKVRLPQDKDDESLRSIKAMLGAWRNCELEAVRMRGIRLGKRLQM